MRRAVLALLLLCACGGDDPPPPTGATLTVAGETFRYDGFIWGLNNDCGMRSVTIVGSQVEPAVTGPGIGLCLPDPDRVGAAPLPLADEALVELVGASAEGGGCLYARVPAAAASGTVTFAGLRTTAGARYTMSFAGSVAGTRSCGGGDPEPVTLELGGAARVTQRP
jgi:hypothetical protein